jgi:hypothetical protein
MSIAIPEVKEMTESQREEMLGRLVLDAFARRGFGTIPVKVTGKSVAFLVPRIEPAAVTTIPDMPPEYIEEIKRRAATPEKAISLSEFRERLFRDLQALDNGGKTP